MNRILNLVFLGWIATILIAASPARAIYYNGHSVASWNAPDGTTHYYQNFGVNDVPTSYTFEDLEAFVATTRYRGYMGHLATFTSWSEWNASMAGSERGYVGALGDGTGFFWTEGRDGGLPVTPFGYWSTPLPACLPHTRIWIVNSAWYPATNAIGCAGNWSKFTVEYEAPYLSDVLPASDGWSSGAPIVIRGWGFSEDAVPRIGGAVASPYVIVSPKEIQATVPDLEDGAGYQLEVELPYYGIVAWPGAVVPIEESTWGLVKARFGR